MRPEHVDGCDCNWASVTLCARPWWRVVSSGSGGRGGRGGRGSPGMAWNLALSLPSVQLYCTGFLLHRNFNSIYASRILSLSSNSLECCLCALSPRPLPTLSHAQPPYTENSYPSVHPAVLLLSGRFSCDPTVLAHANCI